MLSKLVIVVAVSMGHGGGHGGGHSPIHQAAYHHLPNNPPHLTYVHPTPLHPHQHQHQQGRSVAGAVSAVNGIHHVGNGPAIINYPMPLINGIGASGSGGTFASAVLARQGEYRHFVNGKYSHTVSTWDYFAEYHCQELAQRLKATVVVTEGNAIIGRYFPK